MSNEIMVQRREDNLPVNIKVEGENSSYIESIGTVGEMNVQNTVNINVTSGKVSGKRETFNVSLEKNRYHLFVVGKERFEYDHFFLSWSSYFLREYMSEETRNQFYELSDEMIEKLKRYPAILANENAGFWGKSGSDQKAIIAVITGIEKKDDGLWIHYKDYGEVEQSVLNTRCTLLGMGEMRAEMELNVTHWAVKDVNLFDVLPEMEKVFCYKIGKE